MFKYPFFRLIPVIVLIFSLSNSPSLLIAQETLSPEQQELSRMDILQKMNSAEKYLGKDYYLRPEDILQLNTIINQIKDSPYKDLYTEADIMLFLAREKKSLQDITEKREENHKLMLETLERDKKRKTFKFAFSCAFWASLGTGIVSTILTNYYWYQSEISLKEYFAATTIEEATRLRDSANEYQRLSYLFAGVGALGFVVSVPLFTARSMPSAFAIAAAVKSIRSSFSASA